VPSGQAATFYFRIEESVQDNTGAGTYRSMSSGDFMIIASETGFRKPDLKKCPQFFQG
jgi:hypothetical protein